MATQRYSVTPHPIRTLLYYMAIRYRYSLIMGLIRPFEQNTMHRCTYDKEVNLGGGGRVGLRY